MKPFDPETLRKCCQPKTSDQANADFAAFVADVYASRVKYRLANVVLVAGMTIDYGDGNEGEVLAKFACGDQYRAETMSAWLMGQCSAERQEMVARAAADHPGVKRPKRRESP